MIHVHLWDRDSLCVFCGTRKPDTPSATEAALGRLAEYDAGRGTERLVRDLMRANERAAEKL